MKLEQLFLNRKKIAVQIVFAMLFTIPVIATIQNNPLYLTSSARFRIYMALTMITLFFVHILVLLPIYFNEKNKKKYIRLSLLCVLIYSVVQLYFGYQFINSYELAPIPFFGVTLQEFTLKEVLRVLVALFFSISIIILTSFIYSLLFFTSKKTLSFLEFIINVIIISAFIGYSGVIIGQIEVIKITLIVLVVFYIHAFYSTPLLINNRNKYIFSLLILASFYLISVYFSLNRPLDFYTNEDVVQFLFFFVGSLLLVLFLSFIYGYFRLKAIEKEKQFTLKLGTKNSELELLKSQVNPHFLFNTLNTLYSTALEEKAEKTAESTAKLANLIRYMQEDISKDFIPLKKEIKYLKDYIAIQELRCAVSPKIDTKFINIENHQISPGLLIPFVENAFKYGIDPSKPSTLKVTVTCNDNTINFECVNSYNDNFQSYYKEQGFGIGIKNVKQRLSLIYPKKHTLNIVKEEGKFRVKLQIDI